MQANPSTVDEGAGTTRMVTKSDGSKVPYSTSLLRAHLESKIEGLNSELINLDIVVDKVTSGIYNGKCARPPCTLLALPSKAVCLVVTFAFDRLAFLGQSAVNPFYAHFLTYFLSQA